MSSSVKEFQVLPRRWIFIHDFEYREVAMYFTERLGSLRSTCFLKPVVIETRRKLVSVRSKCFFIPSLLGLRRKKRGAKLYRVVTNYVPSRSFLNYVNQNDGEDTLEKAIFREEGMNDQNRILGFAPHIRTVLRDVGEGLLELLKKKLFHRNLREGFKVSTRGKVKQVKLQFPLKPSNSEFENWLKADIADLKTLVEGIKFIGIRNKPTYCETVHQSL